MHVDILFTSESIMFQRACYSSHAHIGKLGELPHGEYYPVYTLVRKGETEGIAPDIGYS